MKQLLILILWIICLGLIGRIEYADEIKSHQQDEINKQQIIMSWETRCNTGDIFDEDICKGLMNK